MSGKAAGKTLEVSSVEPLSMTRISPRRVPWEDSTDSMASRVCRQVLRVRRITETSKQCAPQGMQELPRAPCGRAQRTKCIRRGAGRDSRQRSAELDRKRISVAVGASKTRGGSAHPAFWAEEKSGGGTGRMRANVVTVALQIAVQAGAPDSQNLRRAQTVAVAHLQHLLDVNLAHIVERKRAPLFVSCQPRGSMLQVLRQVADVDEVPRGGDARRGDHVFQFPHVSRPGMLQQHRLRAAGQPGDIFPVRIVIFLQEKL